MSSDSIDVRYVAKLARIALTDDEVERFGAQLGDLLAHVDALANSTPVWFPRRRKSSNRATWNATTSCGLGSTANVVLAQAPQRQGGFFRVPRIIAE